MNVASSISHPPKTDGVTLSRFGPPNIWEMLCLFSAWVLCSLGGDEAVSSRPIYRHVREYHPVHGPEYDYVPCWRLYPARHRRRMIARRARGIRPVARYDWAGMRRFLPNEDQKRLTHTQFLERKSKLVPVGRFQVYDWLYHSYGASSVTIHDMFNSLGAFRDGCARLCPAPLRPD